jgi:hypothetical protein
MQRSALVAATPRRRGASTRDAGGSEAPSRTAGSGSTNAPASGLVPKQLRLPRRYIPRDGLALAYLRTEPGDRPPRSGGNHLVRVRRRLSPRTRLLRAITLAAAAAGMLTLVGCGGATSHETRKHAEAAIVPYYTALLGSYTNGHDPMAATNTLITAIRKHEKALGPTESRRELVITIAFAVCRHSRSKSVGASVNQLLRRKRLARRPRRMRSARSSSENLTNLGPILIGVSSPRTASRSTVAGEMPPSSSAVCAFVSSLRNRVCGHADPRQRRGWLKNPARTTSRTTRQVGRSARTRKAPEPRFSRWARLDSNQGPTDYESAALTS